MAWPRSSLRVADSLPVRQSCRSMETASRKAIVRNHRGGVSQQKVLQTDTGANAVRAVQYAVDDTVRHAAVPVDQRRLARTGYRWRRRTQSRRDQHGNIQINRRYRHESE